MGLINFGVPDNEIEYLKMSMKLDVFVEGGTFMGDTASRMSEKFRKVYTIEKSDAMFDIASKKLKDSSNVDLLKGDTREHLRGILDKNDNILFWLDAHWSGGDTYGEEDECPLIEELEIIFDYPDKNQVILIDDARLFLAPPPRPHDFVKWPTLKDILKVLPTEWEFLELEDVIYIFPKKINNTFKKYIQGITTDRWKHHAKKSQNTVLKGLKTLFLGLLTGKFL